MNNKNIKYIFWTVDPTILYNDQKYLEFIPTINMTRVEQLNSITRFCIYLLILVIITNKSDIWIQIPIVIIIFIIILYYIFEADEMGKFKNNNDKNGDNKNGDNNNGDNKNDNKNDKNDKNDNDNLIGIESGYYDSSKKLHTGKYYGSKNKKKNIEYSLKDFNEYKKNTCRIPTPDNPFMNPTINDYNIEEPPEACNVDDENIKDKINKSFNKDLFRDVSDLFERENSQRQFYTLPQLNPPDQTAFANWLYKTDNICKVDQHKCLRYEDLRYKR